VEAASLPVLDSCHYGDSLSTSLLTSPDLVHFCWRPRSLPAEDAEFDLIMFPSDGSFKPYTGNTAPSSSRNITSPTNGRIFSLKFKSSSLRHFFWLQSKSQHPEAKDNWFSPRDLKLGEIVDSILETGEPVDVAAELQNVSRDGPGGDDEDGDEDMDDAPPSNSRMRANSTGGAGADATGGDVREEGHEAREGGADGGRA
jgi:26S proteasome regulatory subunit N13